MAIDVKQEQAILPKIEQCCQSRVLGTVIPQVSLRHYMSIWVDSNAPFFPCLACQLTHAFVTIVAWLFQWRLLMTAIQCNAWPEGVEVCLKLPLIICA